MNGIIEKLYNDERLDNDEIKAIEEALSKVNTKEGKVTSTNKKMPYKHKDEDSLVAIGFKSERAAEEYGIDLNAKLQKMILKTQKKSESVELAEKLLMEDPLALRLFIYQIIQQQGGKGGGGLRQMLRDFL